MNNPGQRAQTVRLGLALADPRHPFWAILGQCIQERATQLGVTLIVQAASSTTEQVATLRSFARQRVDAVIVVPLATTGLSAGVAACAAAQIPVIAVDMSVADAPITSTIRSDNMHGGALAADYLAAQLPGGGAIVHLQGPLTTESSALRAHGFRQALASFPNLRLVFESDGPLSHASGRALMQQALAAHTPIAGVFATNDVIALGAYQACAEAGLRSTVIVGFDALVDSLTAVRNGWMHGTVRQQPRQMGQLAVDTALAVLRGESVPALQVTTVDLVTAANVLDAAFAVLGMVPGVLQTLGEQRATLADERTLLRTLIDTLPVMLYVKDTDHRFTLANNLTAQTSGFTSSEELLGKTDVDLHSANLAARYVADEHAIFRSGTPLINHEEPVITSTGEQRWMLTTKVPLHNTQGDLLGLVGVNRDITERRQIEAALRASEERYRLITDHASDLITLFLDKTCVYASPSFQVVLGYDPAEMIGRSGWWLTHPDDIDLLPPFIPGSLIAQQPLHVTLRARHADGSWRWIEASLTATSQTDQTYIVIVGRDITVRRQLEAQLLQAQKMESIGRLAGGIAHDFNNLLTAIAGYTELVLYGLPHEHISAPDLREVLRTTARASALTRHLLTFARRQPLETRTINLHELVVELVPMLRRLIGAEIALHLSEQTRTGYVVGDPNRIEQVLINLVVNARDAMPQGGAITLEIAEATLTSTTPNIPGDTAPGVYVYLSVHDTGAGFSAEAQQHLFEPFFTTKPPGHGTGLGLATCYGIVKQHGGVITATSGAGAGATIHIYLPKAEAQATHEPVTSVPDTLPRGTETIMLVEDEPAVRGFAARVLRELGYTVLEAEHGLAATHLLQTHALALVDMLVTDVMMPYINGPTLVTQLQQRSPRLRVLFISGYTDSALSHDTLLRHNNPLLLKPFSSAALAQQVRAVLDEQR